MIALAILTTFGTVLSQLSRGVVAASCWQNTPCAGPLTPAFPGTWDKYNYSPASRTVVPVKILSSNGAFLSTFPGTAQLEKNGSQLIFDFGQEVAGIVTLSYSSTGAGSLGLAFTEAKNWTGADSDSSNGSFQPDGALLANFTGSTTESNFTMQMEKNRGGFRYLTAFSRTQIANTSLNVFDVSVELSFQPDWSNLRAYKGYFYSSDDLLNRIWYSGAYTLQTNSIPPDTGRTFPILNAGWGNDMDINAGTAGTSVYVDGSKRDRTVWPGDLGVAVPSILVSTGDWDGVRNTLNVLYACQETTGELPFAGPAINLYGSDTYHMATMIGTYDYYLWTNDTPWLQALYTKHFIPAMDFITNKTDDTGMILVTGVNDWGRLSQGGHNTEANMLLYKVLMGGSQIASWMGDGDNEAEWLSMAAMLKDAINKSNFDSAFGAYKDNDTSTALYPQDGNALSLMYSVPNHSLLSSVSDSLTKNWISIGSLAPELPGNLAGFGQSLEIKGHFAARQTQRGLDLIRRAWGWYLDNPYGTQSTCIEGYLADGSFGYRAQQGYDNDASYTSHSHGWSTGPTDALTSYVVGLTVTQPGGSAWQLAPQMGDLTHAGAGFTTPLGLFSAAWSTTGDNGSLKLNWNTPKNTKGRIIVPLGANGPPNVVLDGQNGSVQAGLTNVTLGTWSFDVDGGESGGTITY